MRVLISLGRGPFRSSLRPPGKQNLQRLGMRNPSNGRGSIGTALSGRCLRVAPRFPARHLPTPLSFPLATTSITGTLQMRGWPSSRGRSRSTLENPRSRTPHVLPRWHTFACAGQRKARHGRGCRHDDAWCTGPILAPPASTLPRGHFLIEPYPARWIEWPSVSRLFSASAFGACCPKLALKGFVFLTPCRHCGKDGNESAAVGCERILDAFEFPLGRSP